MPPGANWNQELVEKRLELVRRGGGNASETTRVEWRRGPLDLPVIDMPVEQLYYNPETHRIRAQRAHDPVRDAALTANPWSDESQLYLHQLLRCKPSNPDELDPDFTVLMEDLAANGQNAPALITPSGILVNGNTRRAVLKELHQPNIRVGVLPEDWDWNDVAAVELSLQLRKEHRRDYSYINELIAISEEISKGRTPEEIGKAFGKQTSTIKQSLWVLATIDDSIRRSEVALPNGAVARMRRMDFEGHQESMREIQKRYSAIKSAHPDRAERCLEASIFAVLSNQPKTAIRAIWAVEKDFDDEYLRPELRDGLASESDTSEDVDIPGLGFSVSGDDEKVERARATTDAVLRAKAMATSAANLTPAQTAQTSALLADARTAITESLRKAKRDVDFTNRKLAASGKLDEATNIIWASIDDIAKARSLDIMDADALDQSLEDLRAVLVKLAQVASRGIIEPGRGLAWLQRAASARA
jgi:hypothetical protein